MAPKYDDLADWTYGTVKEAKEGEKKIVLETGEGALFPAPTNGYYLVVWPKGKLPLKKPSIAEAEQAEAFRIESGGLTSDTFTWTSREQLGTAKRTLQVGDQVAIAITAEVLKAMQTTLTNRAPKTLFIATEQKVPGEGSFALLETADEVEFELTEDTLVTVYYGASVSGPNNETPKLKLFVDGAEAKAESGGAVEGGHSATAFGRVALTDQGTGLGAQFADHSGDGGDTAAINTGATFWMTKGTHKFQVKFKGNTNNKVKNRRMVVVAY